MKKWMRISLEPSAEESPTYRLSPFKDHPVGIPVLLLDTTDGHREQVEIAFSTGDDDLDNAVRYLTELATAATELVQQIESARAGGGDR